MSSWDLYETKLKINGSSQRDRDITNAKTNFIKEAKNSPSFIPNSTRNGVSQNFLISSTKVPNKYNILAFPDEALLTGDYITTSEGTWIVLQTDTSNTIQRKGIIGFCNRKFIFQNSSADIIERWGILEFNLSSNAKGDDQLNYIEKSAKIFLPYDESTKLIYEDKRLCTGIKFDGSTEPVLEVYTISGVYDLSNAYGNGGHLLAFDCKSSDFVKERDNLELQICDYISPAVQSPVNNTLLSCAISGRSTILAGTTREYSVTFYQSNGTTVANNVEVTWSISPLPNDITLVQNSNFINISVADQSNLIGTKLTITATDKTGLYNKATKIVEVVDI